MLTRNFCAEPDAVGPYEGVLLAGVGCSDITTEEAGRGIRDRLFAKALVFDDGRVRLAIVTLDAVAVGGICDIPEDFLPELRSRVEDEVGIPGSHLLVNASHTHPPGRILCSRDELLRRTLVAVHSAVAHREEAHVGTGVIHENRLQMNRILRMKDGTHWTIRHTNPSPPDEDVEGVGPIDPEIGVLRVDRLDGRPLAVVFNFACHQLFGDAPGRVTANFSGVASRVIEEQLGGDAMALFLQGAAGDVIDRGFKEFHTLRDIEPLGWKLALDVLRTVRGIETRQGDLGVVTRHVELPRRHDFESRTCRLRTEQARVLESLRFTSLNFKSFLPLYLRHALHPEYPAADAAAYLQAESMEDGGLRELDALNRQNIAKYLSNLRGMERLAHIQDDLATIARHEEINRISGSTTIRMEIQGMRIGECVFLAVPIEVLTEVALNVKVASPWEHTFLAAFSNGYMHYGPPAHDYDKGSYEVTECFLAPEWQPLFEKAAREVLQELYAMGSKSTAPSAGASLPS